jgi:hypothetical protein
MQRPKTKIILLVNDQIKIQQMQRPRTKDTNKVALLVIQV